MLAQGYRSGLLFLLIAALAGPACDDPCVALAQKVCRCEPSEARQQACLDQVDNEAGDREANDAENACCERLLDRCTCRDLAQGSYASCGLAREDEGHPPNEELPPACLRILQVE